MRPFLEDRLEICAKGYDSPELATDALLAGEMDAMMEQFEADIARILPRDTIANPAGQPDTEETAGPPRYPQIVHALELVETLRGDDKLAQFLRGLRTLFAKELLQEDDGTLALEITYLKRELDRLYEEDEGEGMEPQDAQIVEMLGAVRAAAPLEPEVRHPEADRDAEELYRGYEDGGSE